jgi:Zn-finger nucleic acid-binding protein
MRKDVVQNLIVDRCSACGGVWLDHDELEALLRIASEHEDDGFMNGVILGLAW